MHVNLTRWLLANKHLVNQLWNQKHCPFRILAPSWVFCWRKLEPRLLQSNQRAAADLAPLQHYIALKRCGALGRFALHCYIAHYHIATLIHWSIDTLLHWYIATFRLLCDAAKRWAGLAWKKDCIPWHFIRERKKLRRGNYTTTHLMTSVLLSSSQSLSQTVSSQEEKINTFNDQRIFIIV